MPEGTSPVQPRVWDDQDVDVRALLHFKDEVSDGLAEPGEVLGLHGRGCLPQAVRGWLNRKLSESGPKPPKKNFDRSAPANLYRSTYASFSAWSVL